MTARTHPIRRTRSRALLVVALLAACLGLAGCDKPQPTITWYGNETSTNVGPALYCELPAETSAPNCATTDGPQAQLTLHADDPLQVNIPSEVASKPWLLVYSYVDDDESYRSPVFTDQKTLSYVVRPLAGKQLKQVDLQVLIVTADAAGAPQYTPLQVWVLKVDPT